MGAETADGHRKQHIQVKKNKKPKHENIFFFTTAPTKAGWEHCNIKHLTFQKWRLERGGKKEKQKKECAQETNSTTAAINKGSSTRSMNTPAALCMNLIFSKWEIILSLRSFNRKSLERALTKVHHLYPPWLLAAYNPQINCTRKLGP